MIQHEKASSRRGVDSKEHPKLSASLGGLYTELAVWQNVVPVTFD